jgi:hypothetical protein
MAEIDRMQETYGHGQDPPKFNIITLNKIKKKTIKIIKKMYNT